MRFLTKAALSGVALLALVATAACGDDDDSNDTTPTATEAAETRTPGATATRPAATTPPGESPDGGGVPRCGPDDLQMNILNAGAAAGTHFFAISVENSSDDTCSIAGFPGVSLVDADGNELGDPAERNPAVGAVPITLKPGGAAHAMMGLPNYQNFPAGECDGPSASIVVYPPDELEAMTAPFEDYVCEGFSVRVFEPGANEPGR